ncbi:MAG: HAMP domain-containing sensor histidine kinase, partial [Anaerolineae bacterium]
LRLEHRVHERTAELAAANESLKELDRLKSKFVADVSHELRTPISVLSLKLELLERKPERFIEHLPEMQKHVDHLAILINDILDISRFELGKDKVEFELVQLNELAERVVNAYQERADSAGLRLSFRPAVGLPEVYGEPNQLSQIITNLLSNAIKYTTSSGDVWVTTGHDKKRQAVFITVRDSGMGIGTEDLPHLFERFYRGKRAGSSTIPGTGLGLAIVKEIVDIHNGYVDVESEVGKGSIFKVWLPSARSF